MSIETGRLTSAGVLLGAAILEVAGHALIRKGLRGSGAAVVAVGFAVLGSYGVLINLLNLDFSRALGAYIGVFALVSVATGRLLFRDSVPTPTWVSLGVILTGSLIIHVGSRG